MADDLLQDCVERALRRRTSLQDPQYLYGWLRSILHNLHLDDLRQKRSRGIPADVDDLTNTIALSVPPVDRGETRDFLRAMNSLSLDHRQILLLVGLEGLSYREIAAELNVPIGTVMSRLARAREQLRARIEQPETAQSPSPLSAYSARKAADQ